MSPEEQFDSLFRADPRPGPIIIQRALHILDANPYLADTTTTAGKKCFKLALAADSYELVKAMLRHHADPDADLGMMVFPLDITATYTCPESMRALLEAGPKLVNPLDSQLSSLGMGTQSQPPLCTAYQACAEEAAKHLAPQVKTMRKEMREGIAYDRIFAKSTPETQCLNLLLRAGAMEALHPDSSTEIRFALSQDMVNENYHLFLAKQGADLMQYKATLEELRNLMEGMGGTEQRRADQLFDLLEDSKKYVAQKLEKGPDAFLLSLNERAGMEALNVLLGSGEAGLITSPEYWKTHGGLKSGVEFVEKVKALVPDHLSHLRSRLDSTVLQREAGMERSDSVLVRHVQGKNPELGIH